MRKTKRELLAADSTGDKDRFTEKSVLLRRQKEDYNKFSKAAGLLTQNERTQVGGFGYSQASKAAWAAKKATQNNSGGTAPVTPSASGGHAVTVQASGGSNGGTGAVYSSAPIPQPGTVMYNINPTIISQNLSNALTNNGASGIIMSTNNKVDSEVHYIGKIDKSIYKCVSDDIVSDEVIITNSQIEHIKQNHPNDYERFNSYFKEIVENPDFILEANKPNTALILKEITSENEKFKTILRLVTSADNPSYKNSIITFMKIDDKEWRRLIKNKKTLYKSK